MSRAATNLRATTLPAAPAGPLALTWLLLWIAAAALLFEEWFWLRSTHAIARAAEITHLSGVGSWIRRRPPAQALALFIVPIIVIYPFKVLALMALARGDVVLGGAAFVSAKLAATGVFARLYELTEPAIVQFRWIRRSRDRFLRARAFIHAWLDGQPAYRHARATIRKQKAHLAFRYRVAHRLQGRRRNARRERSGYRREIANHSSTASIRVHATGRRK